MTKLIFERCWYSVWNSLKFSNWHVTPSFKDMFNLGKSLIKRSLFQCGMFQIYVQFSKVFSQKVFISIWHVPNWIHSKGLQEHVQFSKKVFISIWHVLNWTYSKGLQEYVQFRCVFFKRSLFQCFMFHIGHILKVSKNMSSFGKYLIKRCIFQCGMFQIGYLKICKNMSSSVKYCKGMLF